MPSYRRARGESASAWAARLNELTAFRVEADLAAKKKAGAIQGGDAELLRRCQECARLLSPGDRLRLLHWLADGIPE